MVILHKCKKKNKGLKRRVKELESQLLAKETKLNEYQKQKLLEKSQNNGTITSTRPRGESMDDTSSVGSNLSAPNSPDSTFSYIIPPLTAIPSPKNSSSSSLPNSPYATPSGTPERGFGDRGDISPTLAKTELFNKDVTSNEQYEEKMEKLKKRLEELTTREKLYEIKEQQQQQVISLLQDTQKIENLDIKLQEFIRQELSIKQKRRRNY